jgi:hypothetical protein
MRSGFGVANWTAGLRVVSPPLANHVKSFTLVVPYYDNPIFFARQLRWWRALPRDIRDLVEIIIVDDGSPTHPADQVWHSASIDDGTPPRLFRIEVDVRWNWLAARNIGMHHARTEWCLLTDMDHVVPVDVAQSLISRAHDPSVIYAFSRIEHTGVVIGPHPNSWFMTRDMFWRVGGYDERLSGIYGTDGLWRRRCAAVAPVQLLMDRLVRYEYQDDSSTTRYQRKTAADANERRARMARLSGQPTPTTLSFPYHEVALCP